MTESNVNMRAGLLTMSLYKLFATKATFPRHTSHVPLPLYQQIFMAASSYQVTAAAADTITNHRSQN